MLIDCLKREWKDKQTWVLLLALSVIFSAHWIVAILYYFMIKRTNTGIVKN